MSTRKRKPHRPWFDSLIYNEICGLQECERSEWAEIYQQSYGDPLAALGSWRPEHRRAVRTAISNFAFRQGDASYVMKSIAQWSSHLGVYIACVIARDAMRRAHVEEPRSIRGVEVAERCATWKGDAADCFRASIHARGAARNALSAAAAAAQGDLSLGTLTTSTRALTAAAHAISAAADAAAGAYCFADPESGWDSDVSAANYAASAARSAAVSASVDAGQVLIAAELVQICHLIGESMLSGPVADWIG